jgi:hypothetical protein
MAVCGEFDGCSLLRVSMYETLEMISS